MKAELKAIVLTLCLTLCSLLLTVQVTGELNHFLAISAILFFLALGGVRAVYRRRWLLTGFSLVIFMAVCASGYLLLGPFTTAYQYVSSDGGFEGHEVALKGQTYPLVRSRFERYAQSRPEVQLYRLNRMQPWNVYRWLDYLTHPRWRLEYKPAAAFPD